jgi:hypothetical protein
MNMFGCCVVDEIVWLTCVWIWYVVFYVMKNWLWIICLILKLNMLRKKETSVKNEACILAFFGTMFHFSVYVEQTVMLPVIVHMYTACRQVIRFGGFQLTLCVIFQEDVKRVWTSEMLKPCQIIRYHNVEDQSRVCFVYCYIIAVQSVSWKANRPCNGSGGKLLVCHCRDPGSMPGQSIWDLWWIKWCWNRFPTNYFGVSLYHSTNSMSSSQWCILAFHMSTTNTVWS